MRKIIEHLKDYTIFEYPYWLITIIVGTFIVGLLLTNNYPEAAFILKKVSAGFFALLFVIEFFRSIIVWKDYDYKPDEHKQDMKDMYDELQILVCILLIYFLQKEFSLFW